MSEALTADATAEDSVKAVPRQEEEEGESEPKSAAAVTKASPPTCDRRLNFHVPFR